MATRTSQLAELVRTGSAQDVEQFLAKGYKEPANPLTHPILELFYQADPQHPSGREMEGKLLAFLKHGLDPNWSLPRKITVSKPYRFLASAGLPRNHRGDINQGFEAAPLLARAAGAGQVGMVKMLMKYGAQPLQQGIAIKAASDNNRADALFALIDGAQTPYFYHATWGQSTPDVIGCAYKNKQPHILRAWEELLPDEIPAEKREGLLGPLSKSRSSDKALAYWMEQSPTLWNRLHDLSGQPREELTASLWPNALRLAAKEGPRHPLFLRALAGDRAWLSTPVSKIHSRRWSIESGKKGVWEGTSIPLPPLQAFLHDTDVKWQDKGKNFVGSARTLVKHGARLWVGDDTPENTPTEAMLATATSGKMPSAEVFRKRPQWMAAHPVSGADVFSACLNTKQADFWIQAGADLNHCDKQGNQSMAALFSRACQHSMDASNTRIHDPLLWSVWVADGWQTRNFPTQGFAYGQDMGQWSTFNQETHKAYKRLAGDQKPAHPTHLLNASLRNLTGSLSVELLNKGADPLVCDAAGWNGFHYLADWARNSMGGHQENAFAKILDTLKVMGANQPGLWSDAMNQPGLDPWQVMTQDKNFQILLNPQYHGCRQQFFTLLHDARCREPSLWKKEDATTILTGFYQEERGEGFEKLVTTLPSVMLDDLLLALFNPQRWPQVYGGQCHFVQNGKRMAETLLTHGANLHGRDLLGNTLKDLWPLAQAAEEGMEAQEDRNAEMHSVARMHEIKATFEAQCMAQTTPVAQASRSLRL